MPTQDTLLNSEYYMYQPRSLAGYVRLAEWLDEWWVEGWVDRSRSDMKHHIMAFLLFMYLTVRIHFVSATIIHMPRKGTTSVLLLIAIVLPVKPSVFERAFKSLRLMHNICETYVHHSNNYLLMRYV